MVHLIVGYGEVGQALGKVLGKHLYTDKNGDSNWLIKKGVPESVDVIHICIPFINQSDFEDSIIYYKRFSSLIIVHSSVPVGTCDKLDVVHSPIAGVHPHLESGIRTFPKYFGGVNVGDVQQAAEIFDKLGIFVRMYSSARITEAMKLWSTTQYGRMLMLEKEIYQWCEDNNLPFEEIYTQSNMDYNEGYTRLGMPNVVRPYYKHVPGPIGGHCVLPNAKLLGVKI